MAKARFIGDMLDDGAEDELLVHVFGENYKTDDDGNPIEQGIGSISHMKSGKNRGALENHFRYLGNPKHGGTPEKEAAGRLEYETKYKATAMKNRERLLAALAKKKDVALRRAAMAEDLLDL